MVVEFAVGQPPGFAFSAKVSVMGSAALAVVASPANMEITIAIARIMLRTFFFMCNLFSFIIILQVGGFATGARVSMRKNGNRVRLCVYG